MTQQNPPQWPSQTPTNDGRDSFGQPSTGNPYQVPDPYSQYNDPSGQDHRRPHVSFGRAIKLFFKNYAVFRGRASRSEYWWTFLFLVLISSVLEAINAATASPGHESSLYLVLYAIWGLGTLIPSLAIQVRRLHDTNRSGWWVLINLIPLVGQIWILIYFLLDSHPDAWQTYDKEPLPATE